MKIICIADTHNQHERLALPEGDILIHAGDFTEAGTKKETEIFLEWFSDQPHKHKIFIGGNHDFYLEKMNLTDLQEKIPKNLIFLQDSGVNLYGIQFWGSAVNPGEGRWAFNRRRGPDIRKHWAMIPLKTQILITHTPPYGVKDELKKNLHIGCEELKRRIEEIKLPVHIFGHLHDSYGKTTISPTTFVNTASLDSRNQNLNPPIELEIPESGV